MSRRMDLRRAFRTRYDVASDHLAAARKLAEEGQIAEAIERYGKAIWQFEQSSESCAPQRIETAKTEMAGLQARLAAESVGSR